MTVKVEYEFYDDGSVRSKFWKNEKGYFHREDGPAIEYANGRRQWFNDGKFHREDGPVIAWESGSCSYYLNNEPYTKKEYLKEIEKIKKRKEGKRKENDFKS